MLIRVFDKGLNEEFAKAAEEKEGVKELSINFVPNELQLRGKVKKGLIPLKLVIRLEVIKFVFNNDEKRIILKINELKPRVLASDMVLGKLVSSKVPYLNYDAKQKIVDLDLAEHKSIKKREEEIEEVILNSLTIRQGVLEVDIEGLGLKEVDDIVKDRAFIEIIKTEAELEAEEQARLAAEADKAAEEEEDDEEESEKV